MQKIDSRTFVGKEFVTSQLPAMRSIVLLRRIVAAISPSLAAVAGDASTKSAKLSLGEMLDTVSAPGLGGAVELLFKNLSEQELTGIIKEMLSCTQVDGVPVMAQFDILFQGQIEEVWPLLQWVFEVNFGSFYARVAGAFRTLRPTPKPSLSSSSPAA